jgi:hypothetical protein
MEELIIYLISFRMISSPEGRWAYKNAHKQKDEYAVGM